MIKYILVLVHNDTPTVLATTALQQTCLDWEAFLRYYDYVGWCITATTV